MYLNAFLCNLTSIFCVQSSVMKWPLLFSANWMLYFCSNDFSICLLLSKCWLGCRLFSQMNECIERFGVNFISVSNILYDCYFRTLMSLQNMKIMFSFIKIWFTLTLILKYYHILCDQNFTYTVVCMTFMSVDMNDLQVKIYFIWKYIIICVV